MSSESIQVQDRLKAEALTQKHVFIAAPFFNVHEIDEVEKIEDMCDQAGLRYFSAMREPPNPLTPGQMQDPRIRAQVNTMCREGLEQSFAVIAWLDRIQLSGDEVMLVHRPMLSEAKGPLREKGEIVGGMVKRRDMIKVDDGVLWECGYAAAFDIPVFGYTERPREQMNMMLSENLMGIAHGRSRLDLLLRALATSDPIVKVGELIESWEDA